MISNNISTQVKSAAHDHIRHKLHYFKIMLCTSQFWGKCTGSKHLIQKGFWTQDQKADMGKREDYAYIWKDFSLEIMIIFANSSPFIFYAVWFRQVLVENILFTNKVQGV